MLTISTPTLVEPATATSDSARRSRAVRWVEVSLLVVAAVFFALHFVHLTADFPNYSFWKDWAKYTDEGWYGDAAIRHYQLGHWNVPGDFNPGAALPVWPAMELVLFRFTGVSLVASRAMTVVVFGLVMIGCYGLLRRWVEPAGKAPSLVPAGVVVLLAVSPFCFVFTRMSILEPLLILLMLVALLLASAAGAARDPLRWAVALGVACSAMVLTKTTALFLFPAILWMLWSAAGYLWRRFLRVAIMAGGVGAATWGAYFLFFVRPRYLVDYRYLFSANAYTTFKWKTLGTLLFNTLFDGIWIGKTLFALALIAIVGAVVRIVAKGVRANPLQITMLLWILGYGAFMAYHANLQPRYYLVVAVPLTVLAATMAEPLLASGLRTWTKQPLEAGETPAGTVDVLLLRMVAGAAAAALLFAAGNAARQTVGFVKRPEYTWISAAWRIREAVDREVAAHPERSRMVLSISGSDLSLMTGLPSICDDFGSMTLSNRVATYKPGWFMTWNDVEDDKMEALAPRYRLERVLTLPAFDDPDRNLLILYRLDPLTAPGQQPAPRRKGVPRSVRARVN